MYNCFVYELFDFKSRLDYWIQYLMANIINDKCLLRKYTILEA